MADILSSSDCASVCVCVCAQQTGQTVGVLNANSSKMVKAIWCKFDAQLLPEIFPYIIH